MQNVVKVQNQAVNQAVKDLLVEAGELEHYQSVYNQNYSLDGLRLKEQSYGYVIAGEHPHRRKYEVVVAECGLRNYGYRCSKYQIHLIKASQSQSDSEEQQAIEAWLQAAGV